MNGPALKRRAFENEKMNPFTASVGEKDHYIS